MGIIDLQKMIANHITIPFFAYKTRKSVSKLSLIFHIYTHSTTLTYQLWTCSFMIGSYRQTQSKRLRSSYPKTFQSQIEQSMCMNHPSDLGINIINISNKVNMRSAYTFQIILIWTVAQYNKINIELITKVNHNITMSRKSYQSTNHDTILAISHTRVVLDHLV